MCPKHQVVVRKGHEEKIKQNMQGDSGYFPWHSHASLRK